jgi:hypothetical protein
MIFIYRKSNAPVAPHKIPIRETKLRPSDAAFSITPDFEFIQHQYEGREVKSDSHLARNLTALIKTR